MPRVARPEVSVIMPVLDAAGWAERSIEALIAHTAPCYELIVIDNGSCESQTRDLLDRLEGAQIRRNDRNVGYGPASNQGAKLASGRLLVFLNSDAIVLSGWLAPLVAQTVDPTVGAVSPMLLNEDGTLQQAGALLRRDGGTALYGFGDDPERAEYGFPRDVDYAAGACLLVDRAAYEEVGGFDDVYAPAYFEDADLCLGLMAVGRRTVYEPRSRVVHAMGASTPVGGVDELVRRNWAEFARRWSAVCEARPAVVAADRPWSLVAARDAMASMRVLVIAPDRQLAEQVGALVRGRPDVRATALTDDARTTIDLSRHGAEVIAVAGSDTGAWLATRRFHYDAIVAGELSSEIRASLREYQPQACLLRAQAGSLAGLLEAAGLGSAAGLNPDT
jgi:GT2 family glycosyltransferase